jgi:hypothetical protein
MSLPSCSAFERICQQIEKNDLHGKHAEHEPIPATPRLKNRRLIVKVGFAHIISGEGKFNWKAA